MKKKNAFYINEERMIFILPLLEDIYLMPKK
jgi:hypothetical protein